MKVSSHKTPDRVSQEQTLLLLDACVLVIRAWIKADLCADEKRREVLYAEARQLMGLTVDRGLMRHGAT